MKYNIYLYGLITCKKCQSLIEELDKLQIDYKKVWCENNSGKCDEIEKITDCYIYPMIDIVSKKQSFNGSYHIYIDQHTIFYFDSEYSEASLKKKLDKNTVGIPVLTMTEMIEKLQKEIKNIQ